MEDNVIHGRFSAKRSETPEERAKKEKDRAKRADLQAERIENAEIESRYVAIRKNIEERPRMKNGKQALPVAMNLWRILTDLKSRAEADFIKKVAHDSLYDKMKKEGKEIPKTDSSKRLWYFTVAPDSESSDKRAKTLALQIAKYMSIVSAAAKHAGVDEKGEILKLVEGTIYSPSAEDIKEAEDDLVGKEWERLRECVEAAGKRIATSNKLSGFFERVRDLGVGIGEAGSFTQPPDRSERYAAFQDKALRPALIRTDDLPPRPSVPLGEIRAHADLPCTIKWEFDCSAALAGEFSECEALASRLEAAGPGFFHSKGVASPLLDVWLELLPVGRPEIVKPVLRVTSKTLIKAAESFDKFAPFGGDPQWSEGCDLGRIDGLLQKSGNAVDGEYLAYALVASDDQSGSEIYYGMICDFDSDAADAYLDLLILQIPYDHSLVGPLADWAKECLLKPAAIEGAGGIKAKYCKATVEKMDELDRHNEIVGISTPFPGGTMAALVEHSLRYAPEPAWLDRLLDDSAKTVMRKLKAAIEDMLAHRSEQLARLRRE